MALVLMHVAETKLIRISYLPLLGAIPVIKVGVANVGVLVLRHLKEELALAIDKWQRLQVIVI